MSREPQVWISTGWKLTEEEKRQAAEIFAATQALRTCPDCGHDPCTCDVNDHAAYCPECEHLWARHSNKYGCEVELGDVEDADIGWRALPPCGCKERP